MPNARSHQEGDASSAKSGERCRKGESAGAALRGVLLRQPESGDGEVGAPQSQKEETNEKPPKRARPKIKNFAERQRNKHHHKRKEDSQSTTASSCLAEPRHRQATENRSERNQHDAPRSQLRSLGSAASAGFSKGRNGGGNIHGSGPQTTDRN